MVSEGKKRSRTSTSSSTNQPVQVKLTKEEVYNVRSVFTFILNSSNLKNNLLKNAIEFEEQEEQRFDRGQFQECYAELNSIIQEVAELKDQNTDEVSAASIQLEVLDITKLILF